jgi:histidyl-tRNA synthetase
MSEKKIYKPRPISGFPEFLPEERLVEQQWLDHIRRVFESYGFCSIETPSVEELAVIEAKGGPNDSGGGADVDKEIYVLERLHKEDGDKESRLALHFDQTVPLARYVAQHFNDLTFPFKRYQMQKVWRGERPQAGRFREFMQCDIDVINVDVLPIHFDAEMPAIIWEVLSSLPGMENEKIQIRISNRKILTGFLEDWGLSDIAAILKILDKAEKVGEGQTFSDLSKACSRTTYGEHWPTANMLMGLVKIKASTSQELKNEIEKLKRRPLTPTHLEGLEELCSVLDQLSHLPKGSVVADLSIVRGLDYYTGTVYETVFTDDPGYGSICSGGRYDDLAGSYINKHLPGVGISIGFTRLFDRLRNKGKLPVGRASPADILVVMPAEERRAEVMATAQTLRRNGHKVEMFHGGKLKRQLAYAEKKGIPFVWFPPFEDGKPHEVKNMQSGEQNVADPATWTIAAKG